MEFALCASVLFIILFGVIDVSRALFVGQVIGQPHRRRMCTGIAWYHVCQIPRQR